MNHLKHKEQSQRVKPLTITGNYIYYKYTATKNGTLTFYTTGSQDTYGCLYDSTGSLVSYDDNSGTSSNFSITRSVKTGETYYLALKLYLSGNANVGFVVTLP